MRVTFVIQGEGRGHLSQAMALKEQLDAAGHSVVGALVGASERRPLPGYFAAAMGLEPVLYQSLATVPGKHSAGVSVLNTLTYNVGRFSLYRDAQEHVRKQIRAWDPDLVVNFYDAIGGLAVARANPPLAPLVTVGHQYLLGNRGAPSPPFRPLELVTFRVLNQISAPSGALRLALSFRKLADGPTRDTRVVPPLLRRRVLEAEPIRGDHILVYVLNHGYGEAIASWQAQHPDVVIHGFYDRPGAPEQEEVQRNLTFHRLSDTRFLEMMRTCRGFVGTAGFESVAEALWLGKPVMVVPTEQQVEQAWNAREAVAAGAGISSLRFDLTPFIEYLPHHVDRSGVFREWVREGQRRVLTLLEEAARRRGARR